MKLPVLILVLATLTLGGCQSIGGHGGDSTSPSPALYEQLGKRAGIATIVEDLLYLIVDDTRINEHFAGVDVEQFHTNLTDQLCSVSGGPCTYTGRGMRESHADMNITDTEFNALAENLILAMEANGVPVAAQNRLIERLVPMYPDIRNL
ncbi:group I truncated hemoglobin [Marinobacter confluentis]|uniref:Group 1 truncated hemoglobin n=1 Tax=Marinobacter confluentis TaxID=1697557 RepID=A0A4Z1CGP5_9GAMM|nr:group 1 truncated hemoglobin [Marinobacter confluentis]TGN39434.1 group 1 truncated hemoglobin [Marinobacter confluentis]